MVCKIKWARARDFIDQIGQVGVEVNSWTSIRNWIDNKFFSCLPLFIVVVPFLVRSFSHIPAELTLTPYPLTIIEINSKLTYSWCCLYFAAIFFLLARVVFISKCPNFLRKYSSASHAIDDGHTVQSVISDFEEFSSRHLINRIRATLRRKGNKQHRRRKAKRFDAALIRLMLQLRMRTSSWPAAHGSRALFRTHWNYRFRTIRLLERSGRYIFRKDHSGRQIPNTRSGGYVRVPKEQFLKHVIRDYLSLQDICFPVSRILIVFLLIPGVLLTLVPFVQNIILVLDSLSGGIQTLRGICKVSSLTGNWWEQSYTLLICPPFPD